ncbi:MAG TPA: hypothetical protein VNL91_09610 [Thermoanaerobaculia bacterium]|nr:hypothetical protein [Thermoanaerobaculia bacterium]
MLLISSGEGTHGFQLNDPNGAPVVPNNSYAQGQAPVERSFTVGMPGTYTYFCTIVTCSSGHSAMFGTFDVGAPTENPGDRY